MLTGEQTTLQRARAGDERAFRELTDPYRRELQVHCYRMLGSLTDAEDMLQETLLAAWRGLGGFEGRASLRTWLYRIATNRCLNALRDRRSAGPGRAGAAVPAARAQPPRRDHLAAALPGRPAGRDRRHRAGARGPLPGHRGGRAGLRRRRCSACRPGRPPRCVLRDVLGFATAEVAGMLGTSQTAVKGALQRARAALEQAPAAGRAPRPGLGRRSATSPGASPTRSSPTTSTASSRCSPTTRGWPCRRRRTSTTAPSAIAAFLRASFAYRGDRRVRLVPTRANTQPAFGCYLADRPDRAAAPAGLIVLTMAGDRIHAITRFHLDALYARFGLPTVLPAPAGPSAGRQRVGRA